MKTFRLFFETVFLLTLAVFSTTAQTQVIMITKDGDSTKVFVDSLQKTNSYAFFDDDIDNLQQKLDSFMSIKRSNIDSVMRVMAIKLDSLQQNISMFSFDMGDDFFKNIIPSDSDLNNMMNINMDMKVEIDTLADGSIVRNMVITGIGNGTGDEAGHSIIISSDDSGKGKYIIKSDEPEEELMSDIPVSDLHILKKAGFSVAMFSEKPLIFNNENISIERKKTDKKDEIDISIKADLPSKGKTTITLVNKTGDVVDENKMKNSDKINVKYSLNVDSAPYYIVVVQNKKAWAKKVVF